MMIGCELKHITVEKAKKLSGGGYILSVVLIVIGLITCYLNYDFIDLHFAFIRNPAFFISARYRLPMHFYLLEKGLVQA